MKSMEADVIVVAAGGAGLAATAAAAEKGAKVITFEKAASLGGSANRARGLLGIETRHQRYRKLAITKEDAFDFHMNYTHWRVDARLVKEYYEKSASTIEWLEGMGVEFIDIQNHNYGYWLTWHLIKGPLVPREIPGTGVVAMKLLAKRAREFGAEFCNRTPVTGLIMEKGRVAGVRAKPKNGGEIEARARAVIIATGGFSDNPAMIKECTGWEMGRGMVRGLDGDGLRMAWAAGAARSDIIMHMAATPGGGMALMMVSWTFLQPGLFVNRSGERFMNEEKMSTTPFGGNAVARQKDRCAFSIFDEDTKRHFVEEGLDFPPGILVNMPVDKITSFDADLDKALAEGAEGVYKAESIEDLAKQTGIDLAGLQRTLDEYNEACATGRDGVFYKSARFLRPVKKPPFYAARLACRASLGSLGGLKINYKTEVLDTADDPIPGLYAAGNDANTIYGDTYLFYLPGNTLGFAVNSGRMAGENAAAYALGKK